MAKSGAQTKPAPRRLCLDSSTTYLVDLVLASLNSQHTRRSYAKAYESLRDFSKGRGLNRLMILRWREGMSKLSSSTVNVRLSALRLLLSEALRAEVIDGKEYAELMDIKGMPRRGARTGRWLTRTEAASLIRSASSNTLRGKRSRCILALFLGCGLRCAELQSLEVELFQRREGRWVISDLVGKGRRLRTVPVPNETKQIVDAWMKAANISAGPIIRPMTLKPVGLSQYAIWEIVKKAGDVIGIELSPHDLRRTYAKLCRKRGGSLEQIQMSLGHASIQTTQVYLGSEQDFEVAVNDDLGIW